MSVPLRSILVCLSVLLATTATPRAQDDWKKTLATYQEWLQRPSLYKRTLGRERFAQSVDPRAFDILVKSYAKPEEPQDQNRYLIASIVMRAFKRNADQAQLSAWRKKFSRPEDAWMWFETERPSAKAQFDELRTQILGKGDAFLRVTALEALADAASHGNEAEHLPELCLEVLESLPKKEVERALLVESVGRVLVAVKRQVRGDTWKPVAEALIRQFDEADTPQRTKVVLSRYFSQIFNVTNLGFESRWWTNELARDASAPKSRGGTTTSVPFYSIRTVGYRFVYVIDASDSMCKRVSDREKRDIGPTTGEKPKPKDGPDGGFVPKENELDWNRIITRFDVGREFVRQSLLSLTPEHSFAIVLFGDSADFLKTTPKLVQATAQNVKAAIAELEAIQTGEPRADRPDGVLFGKTNLHASFARAFEVTKAGLTKRSEYVDPKALVDGCDSIFLLSDGAPSWDDFDEVDARDPEDQAGDPETHQKYQNVDRLRFQGPYAHPPYSHLVDDIERMNLFRKAEIHCVGIGEANQDLLDAIAKIGGGKSIRIQGEKK
ncbi:MAG: hypothetical protein U1F36_19795 [Planctomycetota bacterium]